MISPQWFTPRRTLRQKPLPTKSVTSAPQRWRNLDDSSAELKKAKTRPMQLRSMLGVPAAHLVGRRSWRRGQTASGGSIPRWSTGTPQVVTRRKATGAGKKKYATKIDVRCNDRNRIISSKCILIATGGSATAEMSMRYSTFSQWLSRVWLAFMDESQQYGNYHEIAALAAIQQPAFIVFVGDHRQTPGGLSKGRAAAANRQKLLQRPPESAESSGWLSPAGTTSQPGRPTVAWRESRQWLGHCPPASIRQSTSLRSVDYNSSDTGIAPLIGTPPWPADTESD